MSVRGDAVAQCALSLLMLLSEHCSALSLAVWRGSNLVIDMPAIRYSTDRIIIVYYSSIACRFYNPYPMLSTEHEACQRTVSIKV